MTKITFKLEESEARRLRQAAKQCQITLSEYPDQTEPHEGTGLTWPHQYTYGTAYRNSLDATWVAMAKALVAGERVHIIAYNATEKTRITNLLTVAEVPLAKVDFVIRQSDDV